MTNAIEKARWSCALVLVGVAAGCSARATSTEPRELTATSRQPLASSNGLGQNGLSTNGLWANGLWANGLWANGLWANGLWANGLWANGLWANGLWANGLWANGLWANGLWANGLWANGLWANGLDLASGVSQPGSPSDTLRSSPSLRQLLQYVYACAMPRTGTLNPDGGAPLSFDTTLDPNKGTLACTPAAQCDDAGSSGDAGSTCSTQPTCDVGYTCNAQTNACVIPLTGSIGLAINADGTHWWDPPAASEAGATEAGTSEAGTCDESCQRWVSACVLARTNAYGVHVEISMRASATAPPGVRTDPGSQFAQIQAALSTSQAEIAPCEAGTDPSTCGFTLREGAYYGNIFATTPVNPAPTQTDGGPYSGPATGPIASTPSFNACAGPDSNVPEITKRFCSSQGDQVVINVPGVCVTTATQTGVCGGMDSATTGAIYDCHDATGTRYDQVITVYLKTPIAVCGNAVCEPPTETTTNCPSDCHPGTWVKDIAPNIEESDVFSSAVDLGARTNSMTVVAPDNAVVVAGTAQGDNNLGGGSLPRFIQGVDQGVGVLAKYNPDGTYAWGSRFGNPSSSASGAQLQQANGVSVTVGSSAPYADNIIVAGLAADGNSEQYIWIGIYAADGTPVGTWALPIGPSNSLWLQPTVVAVDSYGNIVLAGSYAGTANIGSFSLTNGATGAAPTTEFITKISLPVAGGGSDAGFDAAPDGGLSTPAVLWAQDLPLALPLNLEDSPPLSLVVDSADNIVLTLGGAYPALIKLPSQGGNWMWAKSLNHSPAAAGASYSATAVDVQGNVYATGYLSSDGNPNGGKVGSCDPVYGVYGMTGLVPFIVKFDANGNCQWLNYANIVCPPTTPNCPVTAAEGVVISFDPAGNVVLGSFGDPAVGGGIDFTGAIGTVNDAAARTFPPFPTYSRPNIFLSAYTRDLGQLVWAKQIPTILSSGLLGMAIDGQGRVIVSGNYSGSMQVDNQLLVTPVPEDPNVIDSFIASFGGPSPLDTTPPVISNLPSNIVAQATSSAGACVFFMPPTAIDNGTAADGGIGPPGTSVWCSPPPNTTFPINTQAVPSTTVTCFASNSLGYQSSASFTVTVVDTMPPVLTVPQSLTAQATGPGGATVTYTTTAIDQVDDSATSCSSCGLPPAPPPTTCAASPIGSVQVTCTRASGSTFAVGTTTVTCSATDDHGNTGTGSFTVTVTETPPVVTVPSNITTPANTLGGAVVTVSPTPSAADVVDGTDPVTCTPPLGSTFAVGTTTVNCSATNANHKTGTASFTVTVIDTPPVVTVPPNVTAPASGPSGAVVTFAASATDVVDGTDPVTCTPAPGSTFAIGTTTGTCSATDSAGNKGSVPFTVTVVDTLPPVVAVPGNITTPATGSSGAVVTFTATATDPVYGTIPPTCTPASGATFALGTTTVTCTATDAAGNAAVSKTFTVTVTDPPPVVTVPSSITVQATSTNGAAVTFTASATDVVDGTDPVTCSPASGSTFALGTTTVTCTATDKHGSTGTASFTVTVTGQPNGDACTAAGQCASGFCVTGVCCNTACGGGTPAPCEACSVALGASVNGTCSTITTKNLSSSGVCSGAVCAPSGKTISGYITVPASTSCVLIGAYSGNVSAGKSSNLTLAGASVKGNVQASNSASVTFSAGSSVNGNVQTTGTGSVAIAGATIGGNAQAQACGTFSLSGSTVKGNLQVEQDTGATSVTSDAVSGNVQIEDDAHGVVCSGNKVSGNIQIEGNSGGVSVTGNTWSGNLQCQENVPPATKPASQCGG